MPKARPCVDQPPTGNQEAATLVSKAALRPCRNSQMLTAASTAQLPLEPILLAGLPNEEACAAGVMPSAAVESAAVQPADDWSKVKPNNEKL